MFDINNARDFYEKLLADFDDLMENRHSARHAMNCAITAHHMHDWVWGDFLKTNRELREKLGIGSKDEFAKWISTQTVWFEPVQQIANGSKHFVRATSDMTARVGGGFGQGGYGVGPYGQGYLSVYMGGSDPAFQYMAVTQLLEVIIRFWRDFLRENSPYAELPMGKTALFSP